MAEGAGAGRALWVGTSWKMNHLRAEAAAWCDAVRAGLPADPRLRPFVAPPFTSLAPVAERLAGSPVTVGVQNLHWKDAGAWTGEVSAPMARECGARLAVLGHSERRRWFGETDETVAWKVAAALRHGILPLVCVGETAEERAEGRADEAVARQARAALLAAGPEPIALAYEPVWAIGQGAASAGPEHVEGRLAALARAAEEAGAPRPVLLYGGSVDAGTAAPLLAVEAVDGLFVGRAALRPEGFLAVAEAALAAR